jgi:hypothetical protein
MERKGGKTFHPPWVDMINDKSFVVYYTRLISAALYVLANQQWVYRLYIQN